jgi:hypothetical protein
MKGPKETYPYAFLPMGKTRYHFFFEHFRTVGDNLKKNCEENNVSVPGWWDMDALMDCYRPIPHWKDQPIHKQPAEFDMYLTNWKTPLRPFGIGGPEGNPLLYEVMKMTDPYALSIWMNPVAAKERGIADGDTITVESYKGKMTGRVKVTERIHPEMVHVFETADSHTRELLKQKDQEIAELKRQLHEERNDNFFRLRRETESARTAVPA